MSDDKNIYPTHDCFTDSLELFNELLLAAKRQRIDARPDLRLVHAVCQLSTGVRYAHGWIEDLREDVCIFYGILKGERKVFGAQPISAYRKSRSIQELVTYTYAEALRENRRSGHYGPWLDSIRQYCSSSPVVFDEAEST